MINILHLVWIIPISIIVGIFLLALVSANKHCVSKDICRACADRGHCEWWCDGESFTLSNKFEK